MPGALRRRRERCGRRQGSHAAAVAGPEALGPRSGGRWPCRPWSAARAACRSANRCRPISCRRKKLKAARLDLSATEALSILKSVRVVDIDLGDGTSKRSVTRGTQRAAPVLRALGIADLDPPTPPRPGQTVM